MSKRSAQADVIERKRKCLAIDEEEERLRAVLTAARDKRHSFVADPAQARVLQLRKEYKLDSAILEANQNLLDCQRKRHEYFDETIHKNAPEAIAETKRKFDRSVRKTQTKRDIITEYNNALDNRKLASLSDSVIASVINLEYYRAGIYAAVEVIESVGVSRINVHAMSLPVDVVRHLRASDRLQRCDNKNCLKCR